MSASDTGYRAEALIGQDIAAYLKAHEEKTMLRFITCGSVDDGKSTLIGRLLYDSKMIFDDQLSALEAASKKSGTQGDAIDFALLVDGLAAEREQGITIDVAYRFFATEKRKFIVADTPGHEQYTRNMVTGASTADLAVLLVDARQGVLTQTRRHAYLVHLLGIKHIVLAVNKMDLVDFSETASTTLSMISMPLPPISIWRRLWPFPYRGWPVTILPASATTRLGIKGRRFWRILKMSNWLKMRRKSKALPCRCNGSIGPISIFADLAGVAGGTVKPGDKIRIVPSGKTSTVKEIVTMAANGSRADLSEALAGQSVTLTLNDEIDCSRGDVIAAGDNPPLAADRLKPVWFGWMKRKCCPAAPMTVPRHASRLGPCASAEICRQCQ